MPTPHSSQSTCDCAPTGRTAPRLVRRLKIPWPVTSLNGTEWNALTYAGHTVWNVHNEQTSDGYKDGEKRRPRDQWVIQRDTHPPIVSDAVAEALLVQLETHGIGNMRSSAGVPIVRSSSRAIRRPVVWESHGQDRVLSGQDTCRFAQHPGRQGGLDRRGDGCERPRLLRVGSRGAKGDAGHVRCLAR